MEIAELDVHNSSKYSRWAKISGLLGGLVCVNWLLLLIFVHFTSRVPLPLILIAFFSFLAGFWIGVIFGIKALGGAKTELSRIEVIYAIFGIVAGLSTIIFIGQL